MLTYVYIYTNSLHFPPSQGGSGASDAGPVDFVRRARFRDAVSLVRALERELVGREPEVAVFDAHAVRPLDLRGPHKGRHFDVGRRYDACVRYVEAVQRGRGCEGGDGGVEVGDGVLLRRAHVHAALVVGCEAFEVAAYLSDELDGVEDVGVGEAGVGEGRLVDLVQPPRGQRCEVEVPVREGDAVRADADVRAPSAVPLVEGRAVEGSNE